MVFGSRFRRFTDQAQEAKGRLGHRFGELGCSTTYGVWMGRQFIFYVDSLIFYLTFDLHSAMICFHKGAGLDDYTLPHSSASHSD